MKIVIAWKEENGEIEIIENQFEIRDRNYYPKTKLTIKKCAVIWLNNGNKQDKENAIQYAEKNIDFPFKVFCFPETEKEPLQKAKELI